MLSPQNKAILDKLFIGSKVYIKNKKPYIFTVVNFTKKCVVLQHKDPDDNFKIVIKVDRNYLDQHIEFIDRIKFEKEKT